jgi:hypothetical protein
MLTATVCRQLPAKDKTYKKGDEGGLCLMVRPSGSKHWHMSYRIDGKERKLSFGRYHDDPERGVTLAEARVKRDVAKKAIGQGIDPSAVKKAAKLDQVAKMTFGEKADDFLAKQEAEGLGVKSIARTERMIRYLKADFGSRPYSEVARQEFRPELLAFLKRYEKAGKLETVHRLRSTAEQIFDYGDSHGAGINPARNLHKQLIKKKPKSRPALTDSVRLAKLFKTISSPFTGARFDDVVGLGLRFVGYTAARPGEAGAPCAQLLTRPDEIPALGAGAGGWIEPTQISRRSAHTRGLLCFAMLQRLNRSESRQSGCTNFSSSRWNGFLRLIE